MIKSVKDLWIGDLLLLKKSRQVGKFSGLKPNGKLIIKTEKSTIITPLSNVERYEIPEDNFHLEFNDEDVIIKKPLNTSNNNQIDLHIDVLAPHMENQPAARILDFQIKAFNDFINECYNSKRGILKVIHGKGEGVLRTEVQYLLKRDSRVKFVHEINNGGATEVWMQY